MHYATLSAISRVNNIDVDLNLVEHKGMTARLFDTASANSLEELVYITVTSSDIETAIVVNASYTLSFDLAVINPQHLHDHVYEFAKKISDHFTERGAWEGYHFISEPVYQGGIAHELRPRTMDSMLSQLGDGIHRFYMEAAMFSPSIINNTSPGGASGVVPNIITIATNPNYYFVLREVRENAPIHVNPPAAVNFRKFDVELFGRKWNGAVMITGGWTPEAIRILNRLDEKALEKTFSAHVVRTCGVFSKLIDGPSKLTLEEAPEPDTLMTHGQMPRLIGSNPGYLGRGNIYGQRPTGFGATYPHAGPGYNPYAFSAMGQQETMTNSVSAGFRGFNEQASYGIDPDNAIPKY